MQKGAKRSILQKVVRKRRGGGPKTARGKAQSSRNSLLHGLNTINRNNVAYSQEIFEIANAMCDEEKDPILYEKAIAVAECDLLIAQVRSYRSSLIERMMMDANSLPITKHYIEWKARAEFGRRAARRRAFNEFVMMNEIWKTGKHRGFFVTTSYQGEGAPLTRDQLGYAISMANPAAKKRVNSPRITQVAPTVSRNMAGICEKQSGHKPGFCHDYGDGSGPHRHEFARLFNELNGQPDYYHYKEHLSFIQSKDVAWQNELRIISNFSWLHQSRDSDAA
jgi:hypothetical protein